MEKDRTINPSRPIHRGNNGLGKRADFFHLFPNKFGYVNPTARRRTRKNSVDPGAGRRKDGPFGHFRSGKEQYGVIFPEKGGKTGIRNARLVDPGESGGFQRKELVRDAQMGRQRPQISRAKQIQRPPFVPEPPEDGERQNQVAQGARVHRQQSALAFHRNVPAGGNQTWIRWTIRGARRVSVRSSRASVTG